jgi:hypothetical protein
MTIFVMVVDDQALIRSGFRMVVRLKRHARESLGAR